MFELAADRILIQVKEVLRRSPKLRPELGARDMLQKTIDRNERWLMTTALVLLLAFLVSMHVPAIAHNGLCTTLAPGQATADAVCLARCCAVAVAALGAIAAIWWRAPARS